MRVIGVDLAWSGRNRSGVCAVEGGHVLASACLRSDDDIEAWIRDWDSDEVLVAFDAPLIVRNRTGRRPCESVFSSAFAAERCSHAYAGMLDSGTTLRGSARCSRCQSSE